jgi:hypothetical protein
MPSTASRIQETKSSICSIMLTRTT